VLGEANWDQPLRDLDAVCALARANVTIRPLSAARGMQEAMLIPLDHDRFAITVDPEPTGGWSSLPSRLRDEVYRHRMRFRVCHELGHTFTYWRRGKVPARHLLDSPRQEAFCDAFARALLVPAPVAAATSFSPGGVLRLHRRHDVSLEVAARAMASAHRRRVALWFAPPGRDELSLQWASAPVSDADRRRPEARWLPARRQLLLCG
jgi:hypothetical protein